MKIALVHNFYQQSGGEDAVFRLERDLLVSHGHAVACYSVDNASIQGTVAKLATGVRARYNPRSRDEFQSWLSNERPDLVHIHNFFPLLSPAIYEACAEARVPIVQTLHNFRTTCVGALLLRNGTICEDCLGSSPVWGVVHRCYRGSLIGSASVALMILSFRKLERLVDRFIVLSEFARAKFTQAGLDPKRIVVKPNFALERSEPTGAPPRSGGLFVGRLSEEKGLIGLVEAWRKIAEPLHIAGNGPLLAQLKAIAPPHVSFLGQIDAERVRAEMSTAEFLLVPSTWYEGFPNVVLEAFAAGVPVIASRIGALAEIIRPNENGLLCEPGNVDDIVAKAEWAFANKSQMRHIGETARRHFIELYTPDVNYRTLRSIYDDAIANHRARAM